MSREVAKVAVYDRSMAGAFDRFRRVVWPSSDRSAAASTAQAGTSRVEQPDSRPDAPTFVFVKGDEIVGHVTTIPVQLVSSAGTVAAHWIVGFMVLPEHRNGLVGPLLIKAVNKQLECALSLFVEPPVLRILTGLKWAHRGILPQYLRVLNARAVSRNLQPRGFRGLSMHASDAAEGAHVGFVESTARTLGGWVLTFGQATWLGLGRLARPAAASAEIREERGFDDSYNELWLAVRGRFGACLARDQKYLQWRFAGKPGHYRVLGCRQENRLLGYCVVKTKQFSDDSRMGNMKVGTIVDCLFDPHAPAPLQALLAAAVRLCAREGVDAVLCTASHATVRQLLRANGFFAIPGNLNFALHNRMTQPIQDIPLDSWHLMRGDSDADQNF